ncbi:MAG: 16S rRNA (adenine(1518)-N(6)/adenine(1519)-N(6))-dimethyltransferase RsmA [Actinomycetota bacterium]
MTLTPTEIRALARRHGVRPSKALGQHFLVDPNTTRRIIRLAGVGRDDQVLEVGPGLGTLTLALAEHARRVVAVELDRGMLAPLRDVLAETPNVDIVQGDALALDLASLLGAGSWRMVSNLPYNVATPLIARLLEEVPQVTDLVVTIQREVGERLVAGPGSRTYGAVSVLVALHAEGEILARIPPTVFWPPPAVESVLVRLRRRPPPVEMAPARIMPVVRAAFGQRRKTVRNALAAGLGRTPDEVEAAVRAAGVDPSARAEDLGLEEFARLASRLGASG